MNYKVFILSVVGSLSLIACKKEKDEVEPLSVTNDVKMLNATSYEKWVYYSLEKGAIVEVSSPETDLTWDIAFQRWYVKTNSGTSGLGKGGAINTKKTDWDKVVIAPPTGYKVDAIGTLNGWDVVKNVETKKEGTFSQEASLYVTYISGGKYKNRNEVYLLKTAKGKFVKIQFYDYVNERLKGGYPSFRYKLSDNENF